MELKRGLSKQTEDTFDSIFYSTGVSWCKVVRMILHVVKNEVLRMFEGLTKSC